MELGSDMVDVDGSEGEGGGQILRTAVAFSVIRRVPVRVTKVRAGRSVPGLKRQHVSALEVLANVFEGKLAGAVEGSSEVTFVPGAPKNVAVSLDMGTAASITLVLQAIVPAVALTGAELRLDIVGGTDVPWSPTLDYFQRVVREAYASVGVRFEVDSSRRGYFPRGGGKVTARVYPCGSLAPVDLAQRVEIPGATIVSRCGMLPRHVAERQSSAASEALERSGVKVLGAEVSEGASSSPGSSILAYHVGPGQYVGADSLGSRGKPAEEVGRDAAERFVAEARSGAPVDSNLADMLLPLLSLAPGASRVRVREVTPHLKSGLRLAAQFTGCGWSVEQDRGSSVIVVVPRGA